MCHNISRPFFLSTSFHQFTIMEPTDLSVKSNSKKNNNNHVPRHCYSAASPRDVTNLTGAPTPHHTDGCSSKKDARRSAFMPVAPSSFLSPPLPYSAAFLTGAPAAAVAASHAISVYSDILHQQFGRVNESHLGLNTSTEDDEMDDSEESTPPGKRYSKSGSKKANRNKKVPLHNL